MPEYGSADNIQTSVQFDTQHEYSLWAYHELICNTVQKRQQANRICIPFIIWKPR